MRRQDRESREEARYATERGRVHVSSRAGYRLWSVSLSAQLPSTLCLKTSQLRPHKSATIAAHRPHGRIIDFTKNAVGKYRVGRTTCGNAPTFHREDKIGSRIEQHQVVRNH